MDICDILISVIVPVYNLEKELPRCLDSILAQTHQNLQILVIDDGSTDRSPAIIDSYAQKDPRVTPIHQPNGGVTSARLAGVQQANGNWIGFVDGDDEIAPDMYQRLLDRAITYCADISHCGYQMIFQDGRVHYFHNTGVVEIHNHTQALQELLSGQRIEPGLCNKLFRKALFHGLQMERDIRINEDLLMNYYLFLQAEVSVYDDWCPYHYIVRSISASRTPLNHQKLYDPLRVKRLIRQTAPDEIHGDAQRAYMNTCINTYHALLFAGVKYRDDRKYVRNLLRLEQTDFSLLGWKRKIMAGLIVSIPVVYWPIYGIYRCFFQKNIYD